MNAVHQVGLEQRRLVGLLVTGLLLATASRTFAARCGSDPGDAPAIAATRELVDSQCDCAAATTHGDYVKCARQVVDAAENSGLRKSCESSVLRCARKSTCGRPNAVTCCRTTAIGKTSCRIARDSNHCVAPHGGSACVGDYTSCCDACDSGGCVQRPTPTPTPTKPPATLPPPPGFCQSSLGLPRLGRVPFTTTHGSDNCGGANLMPAPAPPFSGQVTDALGQRIGDLGLGCLYTGSLPPASVPDGSTSILDVVGKSGSRLTLAGSTGTGPADCTLGAGPDRHCSNGKPGTDGLGKCTSDTDCGVSPVHDHLVGACNLDANCYFGPPVPVPNGVISACAISAFLTDMCGATDLATNQTMVATNLSSRLYITGDEASPCPRCLGGKCSAGKNVGHTCTGTGSTSTTFECPPDDDRFFGTLTVILSSLGTGTSTLTDARGMFCPDQISSGAFGNDSARKVTETGMPAGGSGNPQAQTLAGTFCLPASGSSIVDGTGHLPGVGALSAPGVLDLSGLVLLPIP